MNTSVPSVADTTLTLIILKKTAPAPAGATKEGTMTTITVTINIATGNKYEGNSEFSINVPENYIEDNPKYIRRSLAAAFDENVTAAVNKYIMANS